jgi:hypothetical protein
MVREKKKSEFFHIGGEDSQMDVLQIGEKNSYVETSDFEFGAPKVRNSILGPQIFWDPFSRPPLMLETRNSAGRQSSCPSFL